MTQHPAFAKRDFNSMFEPSFIEPETFLSDEKIRKYVVDEKQYDKTREEILKLILHKKIQEQKNIRKQ
jgi:hypothetical protein